MEVGTITQGFRVQNVRELAELGGQLWEVTHEKTGARVCYLDRPDENKAFSIAFKTLPKDSTGVFHILEHSVLCGSRRYPVKEPFVALLKSSVQTFLNAFTAADKTVFPVSSRNEKDFMHLMDIYLDAVFHPAIYERPEIFRQEGWRYESGGLSGVVLNEMRGSFASPGSVLSKEMNKLLFPDNCYGFVSGGDPEEIPKLTYEAFLSAHQTYYHPSNAYISLVGTMEIEAVLRRLDAFLSEFERREDLFEIPLQQPGEAKTVTVPFAAENEDEGTLISFASLLSTYDDRVKNYAVAMLSDYLTGDDDAPLKRAILDRGLARDFSVGVRDGIRQTSVSLDAADTDAACVDEIRLTVKETLERIVETGVDRERLHACFNRYSFAMRETSGDMPRSVAEACDLLDTWLYGGDPADGLCVEEVLGELKNRLDTPYFTELIREVFLENPHFQTVILVPSADIPEKEFIFTDTEREALEAETEAMYTWQSIPDSEEARASIPRLELSDLNETPVPLIYTEKTEYGATVLTHAVRTRTVLVRAHFNAADLRADELPKLALALRLLGGIGTERHDRSSLPLAVMNTFGRLDFYPTAIEGKSGTRLLLTASFACLPELAADAFALLSELLLETDWTDVPLLRELLGQTEYGARLSLTAEGQSFALRKAGSHAASHTAANELMSGVSFLEHVTALSEADDGTLSAYLAELGGIVKRLITRQRLTLSVTENVDVAAVNAFLAAFPSRAESVPVETDYIIAGPHAEGIPICSDVGFAVMAGSLKATGTPYSGSMPVLASILNYTHLWNGIRLAGGAYGCGFEAVPNGDLYFFSYRDPNPANSLAVFQSSGDFIRDWLETAPDMTGYILGSVSSVDPLRTPEHAISAAETRFFTGMTNADAERRYRELLGTKPEDIRKLAELLDAFTKTGYICVAADQAALADCGISKENRVKESPRS